MIVILASLICLYKLSIFPKSRVSSELESHVLASQIPVKASMKKMIIAFS